MSSNKTHNKEIKSKRRLELVRSQSSSYKQYRQNKKKRLKGSRRRQTKLKSQITGPTHNDKSCNLLRLLTKEYLLNKYNLLRFVVLIVALILLFVCILYGIGSVITLELQDFWCTKYTWDEVTQYNRANNHSLGVNNCHVSDKLRVDEEKVFGTGAGKSAFVPIVVMTTPGIFKLLLYAAICIVLVWVLIRYSLGCLIDCRKAATNEWYVLHGHILLFV